MTLAEAVAEHLNTEEGWPTPFKAERRLFPISEAEKLAKPSVTTFDGPRSSSRYTRQSWEHRKVCYVVIQQKLSADETKQATEAQPLLDLLAAIETHFEGLGEQTRFAGLRYERFDESTERMPFSPELLQATSVFAVVVGLEYVD